MLTKQDLLLKLECLIGVNPKGVRVKSMYQVVVEFLKENGWTQDQIYNQLDLNYMDAKHKIDVCIRNYNTMNSATWFTIKYKLSKGEYHQSWLGRGYYDWLYKSFEIITYKDHEAYDTDDLSSTLLNTFEKVSNADRDDKIELEQYVRYTRALVELSGVKDRSELRKLLSNMKDRTYEISKEIFDNN